MHYEKFKGKENVRRILEHSDRGQEGVPEHGHGNEKIDPKKTCLNYDLKDRNGMTATEYHRNKIDEISSEMKAKGRTLRKDAVTLCSWVVTVPKNLPEEKQGEFFKGCFDFFSARYGQASIVTAAVHLDETTPHMHLQFLPIVTDKDGSRRLCAKDLENRRSLSSVHRDLEKELTAKLGNRITLLNGATEGGNKTVQELKAETLAQKNAELSEKNAELSEKVSGYEKALSEAETDLNENKVVKGLFGKVKEVPKAPDELERDRAVAGAKLVLQREASIKAKERALEAEQRQAKERQKAAVDKARREEQERALKQLNEMNQENSRLKKKIEDVKGIVYDLADVLEDAIEQFKLPKEYADEKKRILKQIDSNKIQEKGD